MRKIRQFEKRHHSSFSALTMPLAHLRQSILKHAFEGQLVPQDPTDEPASVLLERIRAEKIGQSLKKKPKEKKRLP